MSFLLGRALSFHHLRRELGGFAEIDEVGLDGVSRPQRFEIGEPALHDVQIDPPEELRRGFAVGPFARVQIDEPFQGVRDPARWNLRGQPAERGAAVVRPAASEEREVAGAR